MQKTVDRHTAAAVNALCRGVSAREKELCKGQADEAILKEYARLNEAFEEALELCPDELSKNLMRKSLCQGEGFDSVGLAYCGKNQFYKLKRNVKREYAKKLHLI